ncbi:RagB/SusD family nutrient uptake outer membrane protein [Parapedobacter sp. ISTM3]|uniref:RagB/SusD family nutrient uptake outer membrane protein n=1 Tax=Parapedobacter sp. ISTM3 TaxID=2800130 RepID=UPI0019064C3D|nr:RagB/SusD family nutrient uptake outer membrane protein [Parapedobacter sp. ISTM3]MBK1440983.1 RagB/SusD family nutrient uptake outer membrane protein [Parapedobacter sp. ISTM3]
MKNYRHIIKGLVTPIAVLLFNSCEKYLDQKPDDKLSTPTSLDELQGLLDNYSILNQVSSGSGEASADDYYLTDADWKGLSQENHRRLYLWEKDYLFNLNGSNEWTVNYQAIYYANSVLENLTKIPGGDRLKRADIAGQAYYYRGQYFMRTAFLWAPVYDESISGEQMGIPLRLSDDFNAPSVRASLKQTYLQIIEDLKKASGLLPVSTAHPARPGKAAAYGLLARVYLSMGHYEEAGLYADSCLMLKSDLMDFNSLDPSLNYPIGQFNKEVIHWNRILAPAPIENSRAKIVDELYDQYEDNDLRKGIFFGFNSDSTVFFKGSYEGLSTPFGGVATDEQFLIKAECYARLGESGKAMEIMRTLLANRYRSHGPDPLSNVSNLLDFILKERRKELLMRDLRWMDLKRLNRDGANITVKRTMEGKEYILLPNDPRYALPIPEDIIEMTGMPQNSRN